MGKADAAAWEDGDDRCKDIQMMASGIFLLPISEHYGILGLLIPRGLPSLVGCLMSPLCEDYDVSFGFYVLASHSGTVPLRASSCVCSA